MKILDKKLALQANNNIFSNNILNKTLFSSKNNIKNIKNIKNLNLRSYKIKNNNSSNKLILRNIKKKYIENNILNNSFLNLFRTYSFNKLKQNNIDKINYFGKVNDNIRLKYKIMKNINFHELLNSNDINFNKFNFMKDSKNKNKIKETKFQSSDIVKLKNRLYKQRNNQKILLPKKLNNTEMNTKLIKLRKIRTNNTYKKINLYILPKYQNNFSVNNLPLNNVKDIDLQVKSNEFPKIILSKIKMNREKSESKFYHRLNNNHYFNLSAKI